MRDIDEELRKIIAGYSGAPHAPPDEGMDLEAIRAAGAGMTPSGGEDFPRGTKVNFAEPDLETAAPVRKPLVPQAAALPAPIAERVAEVPGSPAAPDDMELAAARLADRRARSSDAFDRGGRQLIAGLTRTPVQATMSAPSDVVAQLLARRKAADATHQGNEQIRLGAAKMDFDKSEAARKAAEDKLRDTRDFTEKEKEFQYRQEHDAASLAQQKDNADATRRMAGAGLQLRVDEAGRKDDAKAEKDAASDMPLMGGKLTLSRGLSDTERGQARASAGLWNAADSAVGEFQRTLEEFAKSPSVATKGRVTAALRTASSAFNSAIGGGAMSEGEAKAMSDAMGADILNPTGLQALAESVFGGNDAKAAQTISNRVREARQANKAAAIGRLKTYGDYSEGGTKAGAASGPVPMKFPDGSVHPVDPADMLEAKKRGAVPNG
jgi:hypothetical protein